MKFGLAKLVVALGAVLLAVGTSGCQSMERMSRPDAHASLDRPDDWPRERSEETHGVLFEIRHPEQPVRMRLRRLEPALVPKAHPAWAEMWLDARYDALTELDIQQVQLAGRPSTRLDATIVDADVELVVELFVVNAASESFVLEAWGPHAAMADTAQTRRRVVDSLEFADASAPERAPDPATAPTEATADGWRLRLPAATDDELESTWQVEQISEGSVVLELPSRLLKVELFAEQLPYPIPATRYAKIALELDEAPSSDDPHDVIVHLEEDERRVTMIHTYRFITRGERAVQVIVSTPQPLYDNNRARVKEVLESLEADPGGDSDSSVKPAE